jgi:hypothetical protein
MIFAKYQYPSQSIWKNFQLQISTTTEGSLSYIDCAVHEIGNICLETDEEGNCINLDPSYAVDIMWFKEIPQAFNEYEVFPDPCGVHTFAGCEDLYKERYCEFFPEYCKPKEIDETTN